LGIYWRDDRAAWHRSVDYEDVGNWWVRPSGLGEMGSLGVLSRGPIGMVDPFVPAEWRRFSMLVKVAPEKV
jgi:hypothetical protein